ncbi:MAG: hypothetical protein WAU82_20870 [Candidatus Binatus sp.]|uniref:hypothetical protein n=1 Tax=Candidatus Binatus sp. TaxID=2811406 RepID=UPI003BB0089F
MRTGKVVISKIGERGMRIIPAAALAASLGMLALGGCSSQNADQPPAQPIMANFALDKCQQLEANLYKCPAVDQPLCTPEFNRTDVNCVRVGPKGSVFVQRGGYNP